MSSNSIAFCIEGIEHEVIELRRIHHRLVDMLEYNFSILLPMKFLLHSGNMSLFLFMLFGISVGIIGVKSIKCKCC